MEQDEFVHHLLVDDDRQHYMRFYLRCGEPTCKSDLNEHPLDICEGCWGWGEDDIDSFGIDDYVEKEHGCKMEHVIIITFWTLSKKCVV